ncbi:MAG: integration host factor subunit beta [Treponema sp.]|jgi:nucleoid DNA-binding protein|nr:integration host factor subunit beta [Treponema sp.]
MTKNELVQRIHEQTGVEPASIKRAVDAFMEGIKAALLNGETIELRGFGTFELKSRKARTAKNPRTGESVSVPARKAVWFKPGQELKKLKEGGVQ